MAFTLAAWYQSVAPNGSYVDLDAVPDPHLTVVGKDVLCPELNRLLGLAAYVDNVGSPQARLTAPSLLEDGYPEYISTLMWGAVPANPPKYNDHRGNPIELDPVEALKCQVLTGSTTAAAHYGLIWLGDGPVTPATGRIRTVRATANVTLVAGTWVNGSLTFPVSLKAGRYAVVGMKAIGANLLAARLVFPGMAWRPGVLGSGNRATQEVDAFRGGNFGVFGEFAHSSPPTVDCLGSTDTSQQIDLDLIYLG